jgi:Glu-tRNA(Gln) amidotransferase subunit E-like FAD-binding protein
MKAEKKESYWARTKRVEADLIEFGISSGLAKKLAYSYRLSVLERLIKATEKRQPGEPATYFLNGLKKSTMKHRPQRGPIEDEGIN